MEESSYRGWDTALKVLGFVGIAMGALFTYWQYFDGVRRQEKTSLIEAQKPFLAQRQELYGQAVNVTSLLATSADPKVLQDAQASFWALHWGPLATVESERVEMIMVKMGKCLQDPNCGSDQKRAYSLDLAHTIRQESADTWNVLLPKLQGQ